MILLTGASGFIGGHLAQRLAGEGHRLRCLVRATSDTSLLEALGAELVVGDLAAPPPDLGEGCRAVVHCAAMVSDWGTVAEIRRANVEGTRALLAAAAGAERFVHFSTTDVHRFRNWYAQTKREAEEEVRRVRPDAVIVRPATVYGPRSVEVVGEIAAAIRNRSMFLIAGGRQIAGLVYVDNLIDAVVLALTHDGAPGRAFDLTDGVDVTWRRFTDDLAAGIGVAPVRWSVPYPVALGLGAGLEHGYRVLRRATRLHTRPLLSRQAVHVLGRDQDFDNRPARAGLGWSPRVSYADGLAATLGWLVR